MVGCWESWVVLLGLNSSSPCRIKVPRVKRLGAFFLFQFLIFSVCCLSLLKWVVFCVVCLVSTTWPTSPLYFFSVEVYACRRAVGVSAATWLKTTIMQRGRQHPFLYILSETNGTEISSVKIGRMLAHLNFILYLCTCNQNNKPLNRITLWQT